MDMTAPTETIPLQKDKDGTIRVAGTRVTLDTLVRAFQGGAGPEEIAEQFPVLDLGDVYAVLAFYLRRWETVQAYLEEGIRQGHEAATRFASLRPAQTLRDQLLSRRIRQQGPERLDRSR